MGKVWLAAARKCRPSVFSVQAAEQPWRMCILSANCWASHRSLACAARIDVDAGPRHRPEAEHSLPKLALSAASAAAGDVCHTRPALAAAAGAQVWRHLRGSCRAHRQHLPVPCGGRRRWLSRRAAGACHELRGAAGGCGLPWRPASVPARASNPAAQLAAARVLRPAVPKLSSRLPSPNAERAGLANTACCPLCVRRWWW